MATAQAQLPNTAATGGEPSAMHGLNRLPVAKQVGLMLGLAASVALGVFIALWSQTPSYSLLYGNLTGQSAAEVMDALEAAGTPYRYDETGGSLMVPGADLHATRLKLAGQGLPRSTELGFEILDKEQGFGTSQFIERARYQRALEVELARSISTLSNVSSARVHLALPKQSVFARKRKSPSASVLVNLHSGGSLEGGQVAAITNLVAASVPNLESSQVKVVDHKGKLLTPKEESPEAAMSSSQFEFVRKVEGEYIRRVEDILNPIVGEEGVRAQVDVDMDFTRSEQTRESYNPDLPALRSEQLTEQVGSGSAVAGVPGALSNQPPGTGEAPEKAGKKGETETAAGAGSPSRKSSTRNYELDKTISHTVMPSNRVRRLSVAVVVDDHRVVGEKGAIERKPRTPEELDRIEGLVKDAIGFSAQRGDSVNVTNVSFFSLPEPEVVVPEVPIWQQSWALDLVKQGGGVLLLLLLVMMVLRPAMRRLTTHDTQVREQLSQAMLAQGGAAAPGAVPQLGVDGGATAAAGGAGAESGAASAMGATAPSAQQLLSNPQTEQNLKTVQTLVGEDPMRVAQVVRTWVAEDE